MSDSTYSYTKACRSSQARRTSERVRRGKRDVFGRRGVRERPPLGGPSEMNQEHELQQQHHHEAYTLGSPGLSTDRRPDDSPSSEFLNERPKHVQTLARFCVADAGGDRTETFIQEQSGREVIRRGFADWVVRVQCDVLGGYWSRPTTCARTPTHSLARRDALRSFASTFGETGARRGRAPRDGNASSLVQREQLRRRRITRPVYGTATTSACATVRRDDAVVGLAGRGRAAKSDRTGLAANVPGLAVRSRPPARSSNSARTGRRRCAPGTATRTSARASVRPGRSTVVAWRTTTRGSRRSDLGGRWG